jgi:ribokinase
MKTYCVVGLGAVVVDEQMFLDHIPCENHKERATGRRQQIGGPVPTALVQLRRFGFECSFIGPIGDDASGTVIRTSLNAEGVCLSDSCARSGQRSGTAHVWVSNRSGNRTVVAYPCPWDELTLSETDLTNLRQCRVLHLDGTGGDVAVQATKVVHGNGGLITIDAGSPKDATRELIHYADVFNFPERFAKQFFDTDDVTVAGTQILAMGARAAVCTLGSRGAILFTETSTERIPAYAVTTRDSTGAGDVFCAGLISVLLQNGTLEMAVRTGAAAAAIKCQNIGNRDALPNPADVQRMLNTSSQDD